MLRNTERTLDNAHIGSICFDGQMMEASVHWLALRPEEDAYAVNQVDVLSCRVATGIVAGATVAEIQETHRKFANFLDWIYEEAEARHQTLKRLPKIAPTVIAPLKGLDLMPPGDAYYRMMNPVAAELQLPSADEPITISTPAPPQARNPGADTGQLSAVDSGRGQRETSARERTTANTAATDINRNNGVGAEDVRSGHASTSATQSLFLMNVGSGDGAADEPLQQLTPPTSESRSEGRQVLSRSLPSAAADEERVQEATVADVRAPKKRRHGKR